jgi:endonuclease/exonuclease/phosphatase family metal-dependent hydrolase
MTLCIRTLAIASFVLHAILLSACTATSSRSSAGDDGSFSVVTLNIYHDRDGWPQRRALVIDGLQALAPDVIALQEVLQHETLRNQAEDIAEALSYEYFFVSTTPPGKVKRYGNAILTRHPVLDRSERRLRPRNDWRTLAHLRLDIRGSIVDIYNTHLHHTVKGSEIRALQLRDVLSHIDTRNDGTPSLLLGDFNAGVTWPELQPLDERYVDAFGSLHDDADSITTLNPHHFGDSLRRIDHVFAQRDRFEILDARRVLDRPDLTGTWPSDHFGVYARLRLLPAR